MGNHSKNEYVSTKWEKLPMVIWGLKGILINPNVSHGEHTRKKPKSTCKAKHGPFETAPAQKKNSATKLALPKGEAIHTNRGNVEMRAMGIFLRPK